MSTQKVDEPTAVVAPARRWWSWIMPKPFDWVATPLYLCVFGVFVYYHVPLNCDAFGKGSYCTFPLERTIFLGSITLLLIAIDRVEFWRYGEAPPRKVAAVLLVVRIVLIELTAQLDYFNFSAFLYLLIPYIALESFPISISY